MNLLAALLLSLLSAALHLVYSQQYFQPADSGVHYETGKNHLRGIRRIPYPRYFGRDDNFDTQASNELEGRGQQLRDTLKHVASPLSGQLTRDAGLGDQDQSRKRIVPLAIKPPVNVASPATQRSAGILAVDKPMSIAAQTNRGAKRVGEQDVVEPSNPRISSEMERRRLKRIQSRWRKIGPLVGGARGNALHRMHLVQQRRLTSMAWLHPTTVAASTDIKLSPSTTSSPLLMTPAQVQPTKNEKPIQLSIEQKAFGETDNSIGGGGAFDGAFVRRQPQVQVQGPAGMQQKILKARAYSNRILKQQRLLRQRPRISGPVLAPNPIAETEEHLQQPNRNRLQLAAPTSPVDNGPTIYENHVSAEETELQPHEDYHHRKGMTVEKRFKLVPNKVSYRPRLKIRRPGEQFVATARGEVNAKSLPITLPHLTPFQAIDRSSPSNQNINYADRRMQPETHPSRGHLHYRQHSGTNKKVLPVILPDSLELQETPSASSTGKKLQLPTATKWNSRQEGGEEDLLQPAPSGLPNAGVLINSGSNVRQPVSPGPTPQPPTSPPTLPPPELGSVGEQPPQPSPVQITPPQVPSPASGDSGLAFGGDIGTPPPGFHEAFGLNGDQTSLVKASEVPLTTTLPPPPPTTEVPTTTLPPIPPTTEVPTTTPPTPAPTPPPPQQPIVIPENSGLRPVAPPREFQGGFGSSVGASGFGSGGGSSFRLPIQPPPVQVEPPPPPTAPPPTVPPPTVLPPTVPSPPLPPPVSPLSPPPSPSKNVPVEATPAEEGPAENVFTGESALMPNRQGPTGDGYGPPVFPVPGAVPPVVPAVNFGGAAAGIPPYKSGNEPSSAEEIKNEATTVKPSALLSILNKADEGFNQVINHFEQGTPLESTAIDVLEVALGSQKLDSQAKLLSHVDRTIGLDNIQRLQRWANTGGALDMLKEQFVKLAKNYKPPPETKAITIPPQLEYLFQSGSG